MFLLSNAPRAYIKETVEGSRRAFYEAIEEARPRGNGVKSKRVRPMCARASGWTWTDGKPWFPF